MKLTKLLDIKLKLITTALSYLFWSSVTLNNKLKDEKILTFENF